MQNWVLPASQSPEVPGLGGRRGQGHRAGAVFSSHLLASVLDKAGVLMAEATGTQEPAPCTVPRCLSVPCRGMPEAPEVWMVGPVLLVGSVPLPACWKQQGVRTLVALPASCSDPCAGGVLSIPGSVQAGT